MHKNKLYGISIKSWIYIINIELLSLELKNYVFTFSFCSEGIFPGFTLSAFLWLMCFWSILNSICSIQKCYCLQFSWESLKKVIFRRCWYSKVCFHIQKKLQKKWLESLECNKKASTFASAFDKESHWNSQWMRWLKEWGKQTSSTSRLTWWSIGTSMKVNVEKTKIDCGPARDIKKKFSTMKSLILAQDER